MFPAKQLPMYDPRKPYNDLPRLPPDADLESKVVLKQCIAARAAVAELRAAGHLIPNASILISSIPLLEAKDSSAIENIVTTNDALFREASLDETSDAGAKEAVRYRAALYGAIEQLQKRPLTAGTAIDICRTVRGINLDVRSTPGTALANPLTREVIYTPPEGQALLSDLLADWERFLHSDQALDPLVRMAVLHYQFEAIHPFTDGNGRTGRILNVLVLMDAGLLDQPTLYLSRYILSTRPEYYRLLSAVTARGEWEAWLLYMLGGIEIAARWTVDKIKAIRDLMELTREYARRSLPKIYSHELIELIFEKPYCRIADLVEHNVAKRQSASTYLKALASIGVLEEEKSGRDKLFIHRKYMALLSGDGHDFEPYPSSIGAEPTRAARKKHR